MSGNDVRFYCEFCGSKVRPGDRICPHCGSLFSQVRCPACHYQGEVREFIHGCPVCGFNRKAGPEAAEPPRPSAKDAAGKRPGGRYEFGYVIDDEPPAASKGGIPLWVLVLLGIVVVGVLALAVILAGGRY